MPKKTSTDYIYSKPTKCLNCHLVVEMIHERDVDPVTGAWLCPRCGHEYRFAHWKIRRQTTTKKAA